MRFHIAVLVVALLIIGPMGAASGQTGDGPTEMPATEATEPDATRQTLTRTESETGSLRFVHDAEGAPALGVDLFGAGGGGLVGMWLIEPGTAVDLVPDTPLAPGVYSMTVMPPGGGATGGGEIATFDVTITAGFTTVVTAYADQHGRLLFTLRTADGESTIRPLFAGTLVVEHDVEDGPTVEVVIWPLEYEDRAFAFGTLVPGAMVDDELEAGPHTLLLYDADEEVGRSDIFITHGETTVVRVSEVIEPGQRAQTPATTGDGDRAVPDFPVPDPVDAGRGSGLGWSPTTLVAIVALAGAVAGAAGIALARRTH